jgi:hypothetical protein
MDAAVWILRPSEFTYGEGSMITFVFLAFIGLFAIAGVFISIEAKKRKDGSVQRMTARGGDRPVMGRATSDKE